jgi:hypothetical protein
MSQLSHKSLLKGKEGDANLLQKGIHPFCDPVTFL